MGVPEEKVVNALNEIVRLANYVNSKTIETGYVVKVEVQRHG